MDNHEVMKGLAAVVVVIILLSASYYVVMNRDRVPSDISTKPLSLNSGVDIWPQYRYRITHDGRTHQNVSLNGELTQTWTSYDINNEYYSASKSSPSVDENKVYIGADTGKLHAFWRSSGMEAWSFRTRHSGNGIHGSPAFDDEKVYVGAYDGYLYAVYKENGTLAWENKLGDAIGSSPCLYEGVAYIGVEMYDPAGYLVGCDMDTGEEVFRSKKFGSHPHSSPSIDPNRDYIYIGCNDKKVYCYDLDTEKEVWTYKTGSDIKSTPCLTEDVLYITSWDDKIHALDMDTGEQYFSYETYGSSMSSPSVGSSGERVYFGSHDHHIYCVDARSGVLRWSFKTGKRVLSSPVIVEKDNTIICGSNDGYVYLLDSEDGDLKKKIKFNYGVSSVPTVVDNELYVFDSEGRLHRYDA